MRGGAKAPFRLKSMVAALFAATIYCSLQLARGAKLCARFRSQCHKLAAQRLCLAHCYGMRTDALDRFGTRLEHRMTKAPDQGDDGIGRITGPLFFQRELVLVRGQEQDLIHVFRFVSSSLTALPTVPGWGRCACGFRIPSPS